MKAPIRVYNHFLDLLMETDNYQSLQFKRSYHSVGDFELHINRYMHGAEYFQKGNIIALNKQNNKVGIILSREIALDENGKETENFRLTGKTLDSVMDRRVTVPPSNTSHDRKKGNAETVMKHYVYNHFVNPADPNRRMPIIEIAPNRNRGKNVDWESRYKSVADELESISIESNLGWGIFADFNNKKLIFDVFHSKDLTQGNEEGNSPVFFSPEFETIKSQNFIDSDLELKNVGYVGGQGEGVERNIVMVGDEKGWGRFETFIDARDIGGEDPETERELTPEEERELLIERGEKKMKEMETILSLEAEILTPITRDSYEWSHEGYLHPAQPIGKYVRKPQQVTPFQYERDFDLGDRVQVVNKSWRLTMTAPITELTEIHEPGGFRLEATFGQTRPTLNSKLKDKFDEIEGVDKQELPAKVAVERMKEAIKYSDEKLTKEEMERIEQAKENLRRSMEYTEEYTYGKDVIDSKDNSVKEAAEEVARLESELAEIKAKAYADGIVTEEEQARINDVKNRLEEAKTHANNVSQEAKEEAKYYSEDASNMKRGYVDTDIINIQGEKGGVEINEYGVNVRNGDFTLEDDVSAEKYTLTRKTNLIFDHSFEMIDRGTGDRAVSHGDGWYSWRTFGTPYVVTNKRSSTFYDIMFGSTMVEVDRTHGLEQYVELEPNTTYTYSAHCQTSTRTINGASLYLFVEFYDADGNSIGRPGRTMPKTPADDDCIIRYALTFKTPSNLDYARFAVVSSTAGQWIAVDGVQVVKGDIPSIYDPEDSLWGMRTNYKDKNPAFIDGMNMNGPLEVNPSEIDKGIIIPYHGIHTATSNLYVGADNEVRITDKNLYNGGSPRYRTLRAGDIYSNGVKVTSTIKEKTNIEPLEEDVINVLKDVNIYKFHYKQDIDDLNFENVQVGPMAESVPQIMRGSDNDSINTHSMTSILWRVCQKQQEQIEALDSNIKDLEMIIEEQQDQIGETENLIKQNEDKAD